jgi:hypothetical protein
MPTGKERLMMEFAEFLDVCEESGAQGTGFELVYRQDARGAAYLSISTVDSMPNSDSWYGVDMDDLAANMELNGGEGMRYGDEHIDYWDKGGWQRITLTEGAGAPLPPPLDADPLGDWHGRNE